VQGLRLRDQSLRLQVSGRWSMAWGAGFEG